MKRTLSLTVEEDIYHEIKRLVPVGEVSPLVNDFLKIYLKKQKEQRLIAAYQRIAQNKKMKKERAIWDEVVDDYINRKQ